MTESEIKGNSSVESVLLFVVESRLSADRSYDSGVVSEDKQSSRKYFDPVLHNAIRYGYRWRNYTTIEQK